jgi:L-threonylcarbamoyladenylate synthase
MITNNIEIAHQELQKNNIVAIPTETVYGLAGNAYSEEAVLKIFELKKRPFFNPLIVHIQSIEYLHQVATSIPTSAIQLAEAFWPGPLTLVLKKKSHIPDLVTAGKDTVAVRVPNHSNTLALLQKLDFPLAAPSANPFGSISPTTAKHVYEYFKEDLSVILDGNICIRGIESSIVGFEGNQPVLYRHGSLSLDSLEAAVGKVVLRTNNEVNPSAPGMLKSHYAPKTSSYLTNNVNEMLKTFRDKKVGVLVFQASTFLNPPAQIEILSEIGNLEEAAKKLYSAMHRLDNCNLDVLIAERLPNRGLGTTINDRLEKAVKKNETIL